MTDWHRSELDRDHQRAKAPQGLIPSSTSDLEAYGHEALCSSSMAGVQGHWPLLPSASNPTTPGHHKEPFVADEYIERLVWRTPGGGSRGGPEAFDPKRLLEEFINHIQELQIMDERIQRKVEKLEQQCQKEAKEFAKKVQELQKSNQVAFQHFQELDEHISYVATKVCHLGDQLEGVNTPRQRAVEAQKLMKYFNEFLDGELKSDVFINSEKNWTIYVNGFSEVKSKIASKYHDLECQLIQEFTSAQRRGEISRMREVAAVLLHFKGAYLRNDIFEDAAVLCQRVNKQVGDIFSNPETVLAKLIQNVFEIKLQSFVKEQLEECRKSDAEQYLKNLYDLYTRTSSLSSKLMEFNLGTDKQTFLSKLIKSIFISYLENYIEVETGYLKSRSAMILQRYYDSKNHQKRSIGTGGIQDLKERIRQRTNLPLGPSIDTHGETFLSQEVVVNLLQETKQAFERCHRKHSGPGLTTPSASRGFCLRSIEDTEQLKSLLFQEPRLSPRLFVISALQGFSPPYQLPSAKTLPDLDNNVRSQPPGLQRSWFELLEENTVTWLERCCWVGVLWSWNNRKGAVRVLPKQMAEKGEEEKVGSQWGRVLQGDYETPEKAGCTAIRRA
ncbi:Exocyst complex component 5 [Saguinus oedipus]|uniref:Exocyst complex component 5 n=1 Tax=Saguinus oedipus TaxID=9490 RepID=A0ABQ9V4G2_SAGOE|nr:Exocyst complex component 5 [Saguinus oedipus]